MKKVYLAGAISGLTYDNAEDWRALAREFLDAHGIAGYSPLRAKDYLRSEGVLEQSYAHTPFSSDRGIMTRDHWDCMTSDLILVNLLGTTRVSVGTVMEIAWGFAYRKPVVVAMEDANNLHEHPMIREAIGFRFNTLFDALHATRCILLP